MARSSTNEALWAALAPDLVDTLRRATPKWHALFRESCRQLRAAEEGPAVDAYGDLIQLSRSIERKA